MDQRQAAPVRPGQTELETAPDTIFALSSGAGRAGVAVVRLSGPAAGDALRALGGRTDAPRLARLVSLRDPADGAPLDRALVLWFPGPKSFTGEDVVELHLHGGPAVVEGALTALAALPGLRPAEAGEFSRRAFDHGKMDFTHAEGLADLIAAETPAQRRQALAQMDGCLSRLYEGWRAELVRCLAHMEAAIDFADEADAAHAGADLVPRLTALRDAMAAHLADSRRGERLRDGFTVVLLGAPNAGKSSLLNALSRSDAAIVSEIAGTTRDMVRVRMNIAGFPVTLVDTAGLRESDDVIEREGVRRARAAAAAADLALVLVPADTLGDISETEADARVAALVGATDGPARVRLASKADLAAAGWGPPTGWLAVSAATGAGLDGVSERLADALGAAAPPAQGTVLTRARHRRAVEDSLAALDRFLAVAAAAGDGARDGGGDDPWTPVDGDLVLQAEDLRLAVRGIGRILGRVDVEELLDVVFADFCIGK
ncbi:tRNA modification GTPase [Rhodothalassium salexigens DSM 2132]|uniref:tRNA modification GTPase MnmE n=1 Tax=Rhodothalassium salexigens DSM 2132 TaxID=1188247 RepID=A0A4R2PQ06_RHOSA|nr:tRNA uridine-5-carboxymethylaminomethyl(34) synthesis GTPase MnmE [Rhodothalassium salexigens]MBB4211189.1 tRNA modification GTPase [Rhodothalassium salexigens DSM 2132]MBK1637529.1 tRNA uridine-5-carboxymethylaminomethyl(34) synthesis GTPase MnmE [Rhodothalassium salexigens DSM 2132]TCP36155.1 tRNA modification GTPase [Rhodothalassium salexigens DSM 2132]